MRQDGIILTLLLLWCSGATAALKTSNIAGIPAGQDASGNSEGCVQVNAEVGRKFGCSPNLYWDDGTSTLHVNGTISSPTIDALDQIQVNGVPVTNLNILDTPGTDTVPPIAWALATGPAPDTAMATIGPANETTAGVMTATDQTFNGVKRFSAGGIELLPKPEGDETALCPEGSVGIKVDPAMETGYLCVNGELRDLSEGGDLESARQLGRAFIGATNEDEAVEFCPGVPAGDPTCNKWWTSGLGFQEKRQGAQVFYVSATEPVVIIDQATGLIRYVLQSDGGLCFGTAPCLRIDAGRIYHDTNGDGIKAGELYLDE
jgi:hypothetical protein